MTEAPMILMRRADGGAAASEIHLEGFIAKSDKNGDVLIPARFVLAMIGAGYFFSSSLS